MTKKFTTTAVPISAGDIIAGFRAITQRQSCIGKFEDELAKYVRSRHAFLVNSGTTAFYVILKVLRRFSDRTEVVVPAYTAPVVTLAIWKAGLKPVLCDISLETFNMDITSLTKVVSDDTLCVVPTHLFGLPCDTSLVNEFAENKNIFVVEDSAQAMGTKIGGKMVGTIGDFGFFSLAKGKNLSTYTGGFIVTDRSESVSLVREEIQKLQSPGLISRMLTPFILTALSLAVRPVVYGMFHRLLLGFKVTEAYDDFDAMQYTAFQASSGISLLKRFHDFAGTRQKNGAFLYTALAKISGIRLPAVIDKDEPVYNFFPVLFDSSEQIDPIQQELWDLGIDTTKMYLRPVHHCYELGYEKNPELFPNAAYLAKRLLLLPTHPFVDRSVLQKITGVFG